MKTPINAISLGSIILTVYLLAFITSSSSEISLALFIAVPFILIWIAYRVLNKDISSQSSSKSSQRFLDNPKGMVRA